MTVEELIEHLKMYPGMEIKLLPAESDKPIFKVNMVQETEVVTTGNQISVKNTGKWKKVLEIRL